MNGMSTAPSSSFGYKDDRCGNPRIDVELMNNWMVCVCYLPSQTAKSIRSQTAFIPKNKDGATHPNNIIPLHSAYNNLNGNWNIGRLVTKLKEINIKPNSTVNKS